MTFFGLILDDLSLWLSAHAIRVVIILVIALLIKRFSRTVIEKVIRRAIPASAYISQSAEAKREDTLIAVFHGAITVTLWLVVGTMLLSELNINIGPLLTGVGIIGVALGFGAQYLVRDIITGIFIVMENQYRVGDNICIGETCGNVEELTLRTTVIRDIDGIVHTIPHGEISKTSNRSKDYSMVNIKLEVAYSTKLDALEALLNEVGQAFFEDPAWSDKLIEAPVFVRITNFKDSAVEVWFAGRVQPLEQWRVKGELLRRIKIAFDENGIEIPFPQQVVHYVNK